MPSSRSLQASHEQEPGKNSNRSNETTHPVTRELVTRQHLRAVIRIMMSVSVWALELVMPDKRIWIVVEVLIVFELFCKRALTSYMMLCFVLSTKK